MQEASIKTDNLSGPTISSKQAEQIISLSNDLLWMRPNQPPCEACMRGVYRIMNKGEPSIHFFQPSLLEGRGLIDQSPIHDNGNTSSSSALMLGGLGIVGLAYLSRRYRAEPKIPDEKLKKISSEELKNIKNELREILGDYFEPENRENRSGALMLEFKDFSPDLNEKIKSFFSEKDSFKVVEYGQYKKLTLEVKLSSNSQEVLREFKDKFNDELENEKARIAKEKEDEKEKSESENKIRELREVINKKIQETEQELEKLQRISEEDREKKLEKQTKLIDGFFVSLQKYQNELKESELYKEWMKNPETYEGELKSVETKDVNISKLGREFVEIKDKQALQYIIEKEFGRGSVAEKRAEDGHPRAIEVRFADENQADNNPKKPNPEVELLSAKDLPLLESLLLGFYQFSIKEASQHSKTYDSKKLNFKEMGFVNNLTNHESQELANFNQKFSSAESLNSFAEYAKKFNPPIAENDENIARNYFHNLLDKVVDGISARSKSADKDLIKSGIYFFLDYAMGDREAMNRAYQETQLERNSRGGLTGKGHASGANLEDLKKLCYCLELFENKFTEVNQAELRSFFTEAFIMKSSGINEVFGRNNVQNNLKSDEGFAIDLIDALTCEKGKIAKGVKDAENTIRTFFVKNAENILNSNHSNDGNREYLEKISKIASLPENEVLLYLKNNLDLVVDIVKFSKNEIIQKEGFEIKAKKEEEGVSFDNFKSDLKKICESKHAEVNRRESDKARGHFEIR